MRILLLALLSAAALSCSHLKQSQDKTLCPESRELVCLTVMSCAMDDARGCRVCQCSPAPGVGYRPEEYGQPGVPPRDRNQ